MKTDLPIYVGVFCKTPLRSCMARSWDGVKITCLGLNHLTINPVYTEK
jgi:hypothetical protein